MATTTNYGFNKPTIGGSEDTWGADLNGNWDDVDAELASMQSDINSKADATATTSALAGKADKTTTVSAGSGLTGGGDLSANRTISHANTSSVANVNNSGNTFIQDLTFDTYGHVTAATSGTVSLPTVNNNTITVSGGSGLTGSGAFTVNQNSNQTITISHADTSSQANVNNSGVNFIQDISVDTYGHVTSIGTASIASAIAGISYGAVGSYVFAGRYLSGSHTFTQGSTYSGSALKPAGAGVAADTMSDGANSSGYPAGGGSALSGTWRAMGRQYRASSGTAVTLFLRIS